MANTDASFWRASKRKSHCSVQILPHGNIQAAHPPKVGALAVSNLNMRRTTFALTLVAILLGVPSAVRAQPKERAFSSPITDGGLLAVISARHGMGAGYDVSLWKNGHIETRQHRWTRLSGHPRSRTLQVRVSALKALRSAIARLRPGRHRGSCEYGMLDGPDVEYQFRRGDVMLHFPCYVGSSNSAVNALEDVVAAAQDNPWWFERPRLQVTTSARDLMGISSARKPEVKFARTGRRSCSALQPNRVVFTEREDGSIVVAMDGCVEDGHVPDAITVTGDGPDLVLLSSHEGTAVQRDDCQWWAELDLGRRRNPTKIAIDLGARLEFEVSWRAP